MTNKIKINPNLKNTILTFSGKSIAMIFALLLDGVLARALKIELYAEWVFFFTIATIVFNVAWFGINSATRVFIARNSDQERNEYWCSGIILRIIISAIFAFMIIGVADPVNQYLISKELDYPDLKPLLYCLSILMIFNSWGDFSKNIFQGTTNFKNLLIITVFEYGGYFIFTSIILIFIRNVFSVVLGYILSGIVIFILSGKLFIKEGLIFKKTYLRSEKTKELLAYAFPLLLTGMGSLILIELDTLMMGMLSDHKQVAIYSIAKNLCQKATQVNLSLIIATVTTFAVITKENSAAKLSLFKKYNGINAALCFVIVLLMWVVCPILIKIVFGESYTGAIPVIRILLFYYALSALSGYCTFFLEYQKKGWIRSIAYVITILLDFLLNYILIPIQGARGAAFATALSLIPYSVIVVLFTAYSFRKWKKLSCLKYS